MKTAQPVNPPDGRDPKPRGLRLLVVEDHGDLCVTLKAMSTLLGHEACLVNTVASALRAAKEETFDVLLSDIGLPDGDGWDMLQQMEAAGCRPRYAIAMSGYCLEEHAEKSRAAGFALHLNKPFPPEALVDALLAAKSYLAVD